MSALASVSLVLNSMAVSFIYVLIAFSSAGWDMAPYIEAIDSQKSSYFVVSYNFFQLFDRLK